MENDLKSRKTKKERKNKWVVYVNRKKKEKERRKRQWNKHRKKLKEGIKKIASKTININKVERKIAEKEFLRSILI